MTPVPGRAIFPASPSSRVRSGFLWYTRRLVGRKFNSVQLSPESESTISEAADSDAPLLLVTNHPSWWDPLILFLLADRFFPDRPGAGPIDAEQWHKYSVMKRLGVFGLDPSHTDALDALVAHCTELCAHNPRTALGITAQGTFTDVRAPVRLRPGAAAIANVIPDVRVLTISLEYAFWNEPKPEVFLHAQGVPVQEARSITAWHRALTHSLRTGSESLAEHVIARDPGAFRPLASAHTRSGSGVTPFHDLWMRLRGHNPRMPTGTDRRQPLPGDAR